MYKSHLRNVANYQRKNQKKWRKHQEYALKRKNDPKRHQEYLQKRREYYKSVIRVRKKAKMKKIAMMDKEYENWWFFISNLRGT